MSDPLEGLESASIIYVLLAICGLAVLANCVVVLVIALNKNFRGVTEIFMGNMAVSDLMLAGIAIPIKLAQGIQVAHGNNNFVGGTAACKLSMFIPNFTISSSILTMVVLSFDRYRFIVHNHKLGHTGLAVTLGTIWLLSFGASAPQFYEYSLGIKAIGAGSDDGYYENRTVTASYENATSSNEEEPATYISCSSHGIAENFETTYAAIFVIVIYLLPVVSICVNYINIGRFMWQVSKALEARGSASAISKNKVKVVMMLAIVTAVFAILWAPYFVLFTMEEVTGTDDSSNSSSLPHTIKQTAVVLSTISNPILYYAFNDKFKRAAQSTVTCGWNNGGQITDKEDSSTQASHVGPSSKTQSNLV